MNKAIGTEIYILGHKAKIDSIGGQLKDDLHWKEDQLVVWLSFDEPVGGFSSFAIYIPAKKYADPLELLYNIRRRGEESLQRILERDEQEQWKREERDVRQKDLDALAAAAQSLLE